MTGPISEEMAGLIRRKLTEIAAEEEVRLLFAIESGSRAWGFHSPDSDYDVRFVYARPRRWHYALGARRDVIERPIDDELDISGWELSKALELALGSNMVIAEWLQSPLVYVADQNAVTALTLFCERAFDRKSASWHYLSLLRKQQKRLHDPDGRVRLKRFFYMLRPALALRWMRLCDRPMPPMHMAALIEGADLGADVTAAIDQLTVAKKAATESSAIVDPDPRLTALIAAEAAAAEDWLSAFQAVSRADLRAEADALHLALSEAAFPEVWGGFLWASRDIPAPTPYKIASRTRKT